MKVTLRCGEDSASPRAKSCLSRRRRAAKSPPRRSGWTMRPTWA